MELEQKIDLWLAKLLVLSSLINRKTDAGCFINDSAHIEQISFKLYKNKELFNDIYAEFEIRYWNSYEWWKDSEERLEYLNKAIWIFEEILNTKKVDFSLFNKIEEYVVTGYSL